MQSAETRVATQSGAVTLCCTLPGPLDGTRWSNEGADPPSPGWRPPRRGTEVICGVASEAATAAATSNPPTASSGTNRRSPVTVVAPRQSSVEPGDLFGLAQYAVQHGRCQPTGKGVLLA